MLPVLERLKEQAQKYPLEVQNSLNIFKAFCYCPQYWATASNEMANINKSFEQIQAVQSLGSLPLIVLSQGAKDPKVSEARFQKWASLQLDLTQLSSNSKHIIADKSGHNIQLDQPGLVIDAVQHLIEGLES